MQDRQKLLLGVIVLVPLEVLSSRHKAFVHVHVLNYFEMQCHQSECNKTLKIISHSVVHSLFLSDYHVTKTLTTTQKK